MMQDRGFYLMLVRVKSFTSATNPSKLYALASTGVNKNYEATNALIVNTPNEGGQSIMT